MQPKTNKKKDTKPILFSSEPMSPLKSPIPKIIDEEQPRPTNIPENGVLVYIKLSEVNRLKIKTKKELESQKEQALQVSELSFRKREHVFPVTKDDVQFSKFLKSNYLPKDNIVEITVSVNTTLPHPSFDLLQKMIEATVQKERKNLPVSKYPLEISNKNALELFVTACLLSLDDYAMFLYETNLKPQMGLRLLINLMLITLELSFSKLYTEFYQKINKDDFRTFREYWIAKEGWADPSPRASIILKDKDEETRVDYENDMFCVLYKDQIEFAFSPVIFKKSFDNARRDLYYQYFKPDPKYFVCHNKRKRTVEDRDGILESNYPHKFFLINKQNNEVLLTAIRFTEYGDFRLFKNDKSNEMIYGENYVGHIEANAWGTGFEVYDDGMDELAHKTLPPYICPLRAKIATISFDTNFLGDSPRQIKVDFLDFAEKKQSELIPMQPRYDEINDCYTLNFYGKAQLASARNFILTFKNDLENIILMQGKASKDLFNLDFRHPLNFVQAFSISLVSIGKKFCVS